MCKFGKAATLTRLMSKVTVGASGCIEWQGLRNRDGYGTIRVWSGDRYVHRLVHRVMWEIVNGPIPEGEGVLHHCDNPPCLTPTCLFIGDQLTNMRDAVTKGRQAKGPALAASRRQLRGEDLPWAKLTEGQVRDIIRRLPAERGYALAREFGVSRSLISNIKLGKAWAHLQAPI